MARANPLSGWSLRDVLETRSGPATADVYGKLFRYLHKTLARFVERLSSTKIAFQFHQTTAAHLVEGLDKGSFDRIEVSIQTYNQTEPHPLPAAPLIPSKIIHLSGTKHPLPALESCRQQSHGCLSYPLDHDPLASASAAEPTRHPHHSVHDRHQQRHDPRRGTHIHVR